MNNKIIIIIIKYYNTALDTCIFTADPQFVDWGHHADLNFDKWLLIPKAILMKF